MLDALRFLLFFFLFFYLPGLAYQRVFLKERKTVDGYLATQIQAIIVGLLLFFFISLLVQSLRLPYEITIYILPIVVSVLVGLKPSLLSFSFDKITVKKNIILLLLIALSAYSLVFFHLGSQINQSVARITAASDSLWHISIINELTNRFPPHHPGYAGAIMKNYHYFYDFLLACFHLLSGINVFSLYYRFFPLLSSFLLISIVVVYLRRDKSHNFLLVILGLILIIFSGNLSYLLPFISSQYGFHYQSNIFMSDQPFDQGHNPFNLLAFALFFLIIYLLETTTESNEKQTYVVLPFITGILIGLKIYAAVIVLAALVCVNIFHILKKNFHFYRLLPIILPVILYFLFIYSSSSGTNLIWNPFWVLDRMMADSDRLNIKDYLLKIEYYQVNGHYLNILVTRIIQLTIYLIGNFNLRILGLITIIFTLVNYKKITSTKIFIISAFTCALLVPLLFIQSKNPYDIIQFNHYALLLGGLLSFSLIAPFFRHRPILQVVALILVSSVTLPSTLLLLWGRTGNNYDYIDSAEVRALLFLQENSPQDSVILTDPEEKKLNLMYVPAISDRNVFLAGRGSVELTGISTQERMNAYKTYFRRLQCTDLTQLINAYNISYVYLSNEGLAYEPLLQNSIYNKVYSSDSVAIYSR